MLALVLKLYGFNDGVVAPFSKWQGPFSWNNPIIDEQPGPPLNHVASGAVVGLLRASKNQNHLQQVNKRWERPRQGCLHVLVGPDAEIARVLIHTRRSLTNARVGSELYLSTSSSVFEDSDIASITFKDVAFVFRRVEERGGQRDCG